MNYRKAEAKQAAQAQFRGIWASITTPFTADLAVDEAGLARNMRHLTDALHVDGVFCTGVMGEFWSLTKEERKRVVEIVVAEARGKCRVIAHTGHHSAHETIELTRHAEAAGADFVILMTPYYPPANDRMLADWFAFVAERVDIGVWLFDTPFSGCPAIAPATTARIAEIDNICGAKIARPLDHYLEVKRLTRDRIVLSSPSENDFLMLMREHGQKVHQSSASPYLLQTAAWQPMREYTELGLQGRFAEAAARSAVLGPARAVQRKWLHEGWHRDRIIPIAAIKAWSELLGLAGGPVRTPLLALSNQERTELCADLAQVGLVGEQRVSAVA
jgi:4-hydroxy-tetrahydrodipicolinate synthase